MLGSITATVMLDVCTRPLRSVGGTRWTRCPPASLSSCLRSLPSTSILIQVLESECSVYFQDNLSNKLVYACARSWANNFASCPPSAPLISIVRFIVFLLSCCLAESGGIEPLPIMIPERSKLVASHLAAQSIVWSPRSESN